jgi:hypothetical protein
MMSEISLESDGGSAGNIEATPSSGPGPLEQLVKELLDLEPELEL